MIKYVVLQTNKDRSITLDETYYKTVINLESVVLCHKRLITVVSTKVFEKVTVFGDCKTNKLN